MKLDDFLNLPDELQYQAVWEQGVAIDNIIFEKTHYQLYSINDFYVEILYGASSNKIMGKVPFMQGVHLDKYLNNLPRL